MRERLGIGNKKDGEQDFYVTKLASLVSCAFAICMQPLSSIMVIGSHVNLLALGSLAGVYLLVSRNFLTLQLAALQGLC